MPTSISDEERAQRSEDLRILMRRKALESLKKAAEPLLDYLYEHGSPYTQIVISQTGLTIVEEQASIPFELRD